MEPEELRAEQRWSSIPQHSAPNGYWPKHLDEKLLVLVTNATASGDRFPVGVNWLDVSRSIGYSPVECLKRYAFLHNARERLSAQDESAPAEHPVTATPSEQEQRSHAAHEDNDRHAEDANNPFSGMSSSEELESPGSRAFLEYGSPLASPRLQSLENSGEFGAGSPSSPPPFALRAAYKGGKGMASPLRWESLAKETYSSSPPVLSAPPHVLRQQQLRTSFGVVGEPDEVPFKQSTYEGAHSPRIVHGTQHHSRFTDPNFAAELVNDAFRGLRLGEDLPPPPATSPRMARAISNSEFPFLSDDDRKSKPVVASLPVRIGARLGSDAAPTHQHARPLSSVYNSPHMAASPRSPMLASFQTDGPFSGSLTQSALEEAFLDMAGSRLDTSSMLFASRYAASQSRVMNEQTPHQPPPPSRDLQRKASQNAWSHSPQRQ